MSNVQSDPPRVVPGAVAAPDRLRSARVLLAGLGNIGSFLAVLLAPLVAFIRLVDRDVVEVHNTTNQFYGPEHVGQAKVDATADRIERSAPRLAVERCVADLADLPWGDFADVDVALAGLDSLRARQIIAEKLYPLGIPLIDGAVGDPMLVRVQVLLPGEACLGCSWGKEHYRQIATEYPCEPGAPAEAPRTLAPSCSGAVTAGTMVAQCARLFTDNPPRESYEINGDLLAGKFVTSRRRRNKRCRFAHASTPLLVGLDDPFDTATVGDLLDAAERAFHGQALQLEFPRGAPADDLFGAGRYAVPSQLHPVRSQRLEEVGLMPRDRVVVHASGRPHAAHLCLADRSMT